MIETPWAVIGQSRNTKCIPLKCERCGCEDVVTLPLNMKYIGLILNEFLREHKDCKDNAASK